MPVAPDKYKDVIFEGATFPDDPYKKVTVKLNATIVNEYIPAIPADLSPGLKLLITAMTHMEGFSPKTRSYKTNNPGNIGNTDSGANKPFTTLTAGIEAQAIFMQAVSEGKKKAYPVGKDVFLKPYYSPEIAKNQKTYGIPPYLPGYKFHFTGQLDQFIKIYSTGARVTNNYINVIVSYFSLNGVTIHPFSTLAEIINGGLPDVAAVIGNGI